MTPWTHVAYQAPQSMGFSRQEYWSGVPLPSLRQFLGRLIKSPRSPRRRKGSGALKEEIGRGLEFFCFFDDPAGVGNFISGSSAFSKTSLNIWKFTVHILLKPGLQNLSITLLACEMSAILW